MPRWHRTPRASHDRLLFTIASKVSAITNNVSKQRRRRDVSRSPPGPQIIKYTFKNYEKHTQNRKSKRELAGDKFKHLSYTILNDFINLVFMRHKWRCLLDCLGWISTELNDFRQVVDCTQLQKSQVETVESSLQVRIVR